MTMTKAYMSLNSICGPNHTFQGQYPVHCHIRLGYSIVVTKVPCIRIVCCVVRDEGTNGFVSTPLSSNNSKEVLLGF